MFMNMEEQPHHVDGGVNGILRRRRPLFFEPILLSLSIQHLAENPQPPAKAFCIGRVYRRESIDPTHLPEFEQLEGIVMDEDVSFRHLLGYLKEFYKRMAFPMYGSDQDTSRTPNQAWNLKSG